MKFYVEVILILITLKGRMKLLPPSAVNRVFPNSNEGYEKTSYSNHISST